MKVKKEWGVPEQYVIDHEKSIYFQSFNSIIAAKIKGKIFLDAEKWNYSKTTGKYRNLFLNEDIKTTREKIASGEYKLINLNE